MYYAPHRYVNDETVRVDLCRSKLLEVLQQVAAPEQVAGFKTRHSPLRSRVSISRVLSSNTGTLTSSVGAFPRTHHGLLQPRRSCTRDALLRRQTLVGPPNRRQ
jgi:hypothetical protein